MGPPTSVNRPLPFASDPCRPSARSRFTDNVRAAKASQKPRPFKRCAFRNLNTRAPSKRHAARENELLSKTCVREYDAPCSAKNRDIAVTYTRTFRWSLVCPIAARGMIGYYHAKPAAFRTKHHRKPYVYVRTVPRRVHVPQPNTFNFQFHEQLSYESNKNEWNFVRLNCIARQM